MKREMKIISGGGGGGGELSIYDIVRMCGANSHLFQRCQVYNKPPFSKRPSVSSLLYKRSHFLTALFENTYIFAQIFSSET